MKKEVGSGDELEGKSFPGHCTRDQNIAEVEKRMSEGQYVKDCSAPSAGRGWCTEESVVLSKPIGQ